MKTAKIYNAGNCTKGRLIINNSAAQYYSNKYFDSKKVVGVIKKDAFEVVLRFQDGSEQGVKGSQARDIINCIPFPREMKCTIDANIK